MVNDLFGIKKLYPSNADNNQFYAFPSTTNQTDHTAMRNRIGFKGVLGAFVSGNKIGWWEATPTDGNDVNILVFPTSIVPDHRGQIELDVDCDMNHTDAHERGFVNNSDEWRNVEVTSHIFIKTVDAFDGYLYFEARTGYDGKTGRCCQGTCYGVRMYWSTGSDKGKIAWYKRDRTGNLVVREKLAQNPAKIDTFYQKWMGVKFVIYNPNRADFDENPAVKLELWLTPVTFFNPATATSNNWTKVAEIEDRVGLGWTGEAKNCDAPNNNFPITWAAPFLKFGWKDAKVVQFAYTSFREIDIAGNFGEDPDPQPNPNPDPNVPPPDPDPPEIPEPPPPDSEPPLTPTTITKRLTIRREIVNSTTCRCDGKLPDTGPPPDPDPGEPPTALQTLYTVALTADAAPVSLAKVSGSSSYYLRMGQGVTMTSSNWIGKIIAKIEITLAKQGNPEDSTTGGVRCVIRKGSDDSIAATFTPAAPETEIPAAGKVFVFQNLSNNYKMVYRDKLLFEYDGGDRTNYIKIFTRVDQPLTGTKIIWQANNQDAGEYRDAPDVDICARVYIKTGTVVTAVSGAEGGL